MRNLLKGGWLVLMCVPCYGQAAPALVDYDRQVHPILAAKCLGCHSQEKRSGGFSLASYRDLLEGGRNGAAIKPGDHAASLMMRRIMGAPPPKMPLAGEPLTEAEVAVIASWIDQGARA